MRVFWLSIGLVFAMACASECKAFQTWTWLDQGGTLCFTDEEKRVPVAYKDVVKSRETGKLEDYAKFTKSDVVYVRDSADAKQ
jgi:hypothetical protein